MSAFIKGHLVVPRNGCKIPNITAFKNYQVLSGEGEPNLSEFASQWFQTHSRNTCNIRDDSGNIIFVTIKDFTNFEGQMGFRR